MVTTVLNDGLVFIFIYSYSKFSDGVVEVSSNVLSIKSVKFVFICLLCCGKLSTLFFQG